MSVSNAEHSAAELPKSDTPKQHEETDDEFLAQEADRVSVEAAALRYTRLGLFRRDFIITFWTFDRTPLVQGGSQFVQDRNQWLSSFMDDCTIFVRVSRGAVSPSFSSR